MFQKKLRINKIYEYDKFYKIYTYAINEEKPHLVFIFKNSNIDMSLIKEGESVRLELETNTKSTYKFDGEQVIARKVL